MTQKDEIERLDNELVSTTRFAQNWLDHKKLQFGDRLVEKKRAGHPFQRLNVAHVLTWGTPEYPITGYALMKLNKHFTPTIEQCTGRGNYTSTTGKYDQGTLGEYRYFVSQDGRQDLDDYRGTCFSVMERTSKTPEEYLESLREAVKRYEIAQARSRSIIYCAMHGAFEGILRTQRHELEDREKIEEFAKIATSKSETEMFKHRLDLERTHKEEAEKKSRYEENKEKLAEFAERMRYYDRNGFSNEDEIRVPRRSLASVFRDYLGRKRSPVARSEKNQTDDALAYEDYWLRKESDLNEKR